MAGRLGDPQQTLCADPRTHAAVRQLMLALNCGLDRFQPPPGTETVHMPQEQLHAAVAAKEAMCETLFDNMSKMAPPVPGVVDSVQVRSCDPSVGGALTLDGLFSIGRGRVCALRWTVP